MATDIAIRHGVLSGCQVTADGTDLVLSVAAGAVLNANVAASISAQGFTATSGDPTNDRYDTLFADSAGNVNALTGVADGTLAQPDSGDVILARYIVRAGATAVLPGDVQDVRTFVPQEFSPHWVSNLWYGPHASIAATANNWASGELYLVPLYVAKRMSALTIGVVQASTATSGSLCQFGVYSDDGNGGLTFLGGPGVPSSTASLAGTTATTSSEVSRGFAINLVFNPGTIWLGVNFQSLGVARPKLFTCSPTLSPVGASSLTQGATGPFGCMRFTGVTGALPGTLSVGSADFSATSIPSVLIQLD